MFAIVDEVDSVLIDEARTPLIISGPVGNENDALYAEYNAAVERLFRRQTELVNALVGEGERAAWSRGGQRRPRCSCTRRSWAARRTSAC